VIISTQNKVVNKGHVEVYRASVDELLQFHLLKRNFNHFDKFYLKAQKFPRFSMHECNDTHASSIFLASHPRMLHCATPSTFTRLGPDLAELACPSDLVALTLAGVGPVEENMPEMQ
jgi:hypothetical protein